MLLGSGAVTDVDPAAPQQSTNAIVAYNVNAEQTVRGSGLAWTVLRPGGFHSNALRWLPQLASGDVIRGPWPDLPIASIDPADIAAVAAVALTDGGWDARALRLTGPEALIPAQRVALLGQALGRSLRFEGQDDDEARAEISPAACLPPTWKRSFASSPTAKPTRRQSNRPSNRSSAGRHAPSPNGRESTRANSDQPAEMTRGHGSAPAPPVDVNRVPVKERARSYG